ncbi:protein CBFA2T1 isoform X2 [Aphidius gifuensis]|uniref:protein CBFA2T1 isoform X2 n=1 Tax=Aphidius gifuensis TaxID=684658 RepID=UPI001CDBB0F7|nr:protein CBFA2T1 isoform X2 [Aphidius gifuensis]
MKAEGSSIVNTVLHKVKVKEEKKECNYQQQGSPSTTTTTTEHSTLTITTNTASTSPTSTSTTSTTNSTITKDSTLSINSLNSGVICQISTSTTSSESSIEPVDLDIKKKGVSNQVQLDNDNKDNILSPNSQKIIKIQQIIGVNNERDYLRGQQSSSGSSGNESPSSSHSIKHDNDEFSVGKQDDTAISHLSNSAESKTGNSLILNGSVRCIASVFSGHAKLKRLLGTLVQFANNISTETGDTVRTLVLGLLSGGISAEEFHSALQDATNFPLRDFVLPYLRHTIPSLKRNLNAAARANNQTCVQFLRSNESAVLETVSLAPSGETVELFGDHNTNGNSNTSAYNASRSGTNTIQHLNPASIHHHYSGGATNLATKRRISDTPYYDNNGGVDDTPIYGKRTNNSWSHHAHQQHQQSDLYCWYQPAHSSSSSSVQNHSQSHGQVPPNLVQINQLSSFGASLQPPSQQQPQSQPQQQQQQQHSGQTGQNGLTLDDEWKNIHVMLNCILGMVEKTKRALVILQRRGCSSPAAATAQSSCSQNGNNTNSNNITTANGSQIDSSITTDRDNNLKRLSGEIVAQTIRATEDRVAAEVKRRAEAVQDVKRVAMIEVQRAIATAVAESRVSERLRVHQLIDLPTSHRGHGPLRQGFIRIGNHLNKNDNTSKTTSAATSSLTCDDEKDNTHTTPVIGSNCWNCGRPALETCGGCGIARYCGSFCQHRDWEAGGHHANCHSNTNQETRRSSSQSPPRIGSSVLGSSTDVDSGPTKGK